MLYYTIFKEESFHFKTLISVLLVLTLRCFKDEKQFWSIVSRVLEAKFSIRMFSAPLKVNDVRFLNRFPANLNPNSFFSPLNIPSGNWTISFSPKSNVLRVFAIGVNVLSSGKCDTWLTSNVKSWTAVQSSNVSLKNEKGKRYSFSVWQLIWTHLSISIFLFICLMNTQDHQSRKVIIKHGQRNAFY